MIINPRKKVQQRRRLIFWRQGYPDKMMRRSSQRSHLIMSCIINIRSPSSQLMCLLMPRFSLKGRRWLNAIIAMQSMKRKTFCADSLQAISSGRQWATPWLPTIKSLSNRMLNWSCVITSWKVHTFPQKIRSCSVQTLYWGERTLIMLWSAC